VDLLSVIRRWRHRDKLPIRELTRRTKLYERTSIIITTNLSTAHAKHRHLPAAGLGRATLAIANHQGLPALRALASSANVTGLASLPQAVR
jgi:hypothetical protein